MFGAIRDEEMKLLTDLNFGRGGSKLQMLGGSRFYLNFFRNFFLLGLLLFGLSLPFSSNLSLRGCRSE